MTWPTPADTTQLDADADTLQNARPQIKSLADKFNELRAHVTTWAQGLLTSADAAAARTALDVPSKNGAGATGTSWAISITGSAATAGTATNCSRSVSGGGLATGGGALTGNQTITVTKASQAQAEAGTNDATAMTPLRTAQAIAVLANPLPAIAAASVGAVGTVAMLQETVNAGVSRMPGDLLPGDQLTYSNANGNVSGTSPAGTWRLLGYSAGSPNNIARTSVWVRIS